MSAVKKFAAWWLPAHEKHLQPWMDHPKNRDVVLNGRVAYQGRKQIAALELCKQRPDGLRCAVDVGAHCGLWSFNLAHAFQWVHAFEPMALHRECFKLNTEGLENIMLHECALGASIGSVRLETEPGSSGNTRVVGDGDIEMTTLDALVLDSVDLIKIDCEGFELNVLHGAEQTIARCRPVIVVEQKRDMAEQMGLPKLGAVEFLFERRYRLAKEISGDYLMVPM